MTSDEHLSALFDLLMDRDSVTIDEIAAYLAVTKTRADVVVRDFRLLFGDDDTINLVATPSGQRERWDYSLQGTLEGAEPWALNRIADAESRLDTMAAVLASIERGIDGRTLAGRKARILRRAITRAREDLADLMEEA